MDLDLLWKAFGPWAFSTLILVGMLRWFARELRRERRRVDELSDSLLAISERTLPALQDSSTALRESTDLTRRQGQALAAVEVIIRDSDRRSPR